MARKGEKGIHPPGGFVKGDSRCWRKGRPRTFDFARDLAQKIGAEMDPVKKQINTEVVLRKLMQEDGAKFIEIAYGKVPDKLTINTEPDNELVIKIVEVKQ